MTDQPTAMKCGQLVYAARGEIVGRVAAIGARRFLVDTGDVALWLQRTCVSDIKANSVRADAHTVRGG